MNFENEALPPNSPSPSLSSSPTLVSPYKPVTPLNPNPSNSSQPQMMSSSCHKKKAGRKKFRETRHPVYRGVRRRNGNKWICEIREPNKTSRIWLGTYPTPEMAARAHDVAVLALRGTSADFNFPDSALLDLPVAKSDIRAAAAKAAKAFKPNNINSSSSSSYSSSPNNICVETRCENINMDSLVEEKSCLKISMQSVEGTPTPTTHHDFVTLNINDESKTTTFLDEEALYNMPGLLDSMAEGLLITPPSMKRAMDWDDNIGSELIDLTLWTD